MRKIVPILCVMLLLLLVCSGCQGTQPEKEQEASSLSTQRVEKLHELSVQLTEYLRNGDIEAAMGMMDDTMVEAMDGKLEEVWSQLIDSAGVFVETGAYVGASSAEYEALEMTLVFEKASLIQRVAFDSDNQISGLWYRNGEVDSTSPAAALPDDVTETSVTIDAGTGYPLDGVITMPKDETPVAAIVFVHGSGPSDRDEAIGANAPFRDLANALAERGIAVLRYDKRTFTHGAAMAENGASVTLDEEVAEDACAAVNLLKSWEGIDSEKVYLLGHSMGGGLLSCINSQGADCAGYIIMAGTPRNIWELSAAQNLLLADELEESGDTKSAEEIRDFVEQETQKVSNLANLANDETVFGMPVDYVQEFEKIDALSLHANDALPVLVLQGEKDRQVTTDDYALWKKGLEGHPNATYISYPSLNHLFGEYKGDPVPFSQMVAVEYAERTPVSEEVVEDIAEWLGELS